MRWSLLFYQIGWFLLYSSSATNLIRTNFMSHAWVTNAIWPFDPMPDDRPTYFFHSSCSSGRRHDDVGQGKKSSWDRTKIGPILVKRYLNRPYQFPSKHETVRLMLVSCLLGQWLTIFLTARLAALEVADRALLNQCYHPPIGVGRMI